jgi:hypothetical protein
MPARIDDLLVLNANLNKTDFAKYLRDREAVLPNDVGGLGDGVADDRTAIQAAFDRAGADQKFAMIPPGTWNVSGTVTLPGGARGLIMQGTNRRQTIRVAPAVGYAQVGVIGFDGPIDLQSLWLYGLPEAAPAVLNGTPLLPQSRQREFAAEISWDLPSPAPGATSLIDVTVSGAAGRSGIGVAGVVDAVHRTRCCRVVEQYGAGDGAERLRGHVRSGGGNAVGGGGEATGAMNWYGVARICLCVHGSEAHCGHNSY